MNELTTKRDRRRVLGYFAKGLPLAATLLVLAIIATVVINFLVGGAPALSWEFLTADPRNVNTEGGIFPAIYGTVLLVIIMSLVAVPVGTITAVYLAEYARKTSRLARTIRFAVNTLAGVPSIVFGLFGLGFFIQTIGGGIDDMKYDAKLTELRQLLEAPPSPMAAPGGATIEQARSYIASQNNDYWNVIWQKLRQYPEGTAATATPAQVTEFLSARPEPDWGRPSILWAALTLALLTLPVVIVAVEESLRAVPADVRSASIALGATRWETIRKIILPNSVTGIMTGSILAVGRGAGEVAPILFTGVAYSLKELPGLNDQFMHLGYHLYVLATQSPNVDQTRPLQFATTVVLLGLTLALNAVAIMIRSRIRRKQVSS